MGTSNCAIDSIFAHVLKYITNTQPYYSMKSLFSLSFFSRSQSAAVTASGTRCHRHNAHTTHISMRYLCATLALLMTLSVEQVWGDSGIINAAASTDLGSGNSPRYVVEQAGVGRLMKNDAGSSSWSLSSGYLTTGSSKFALQTYNEITSIIITGYGTGSNRTFSSIRVGTTTSNYADATATGTGTMSSSSSPLQTITITPSSNIAANSYISITLSGNINIASVELVYADGGGDSAPTYTVTYKANGGTGADIVDDEASTVASNTFSRSGYTFDHWNTAADDSGDNYDPGDTVTGDLTLYAQWEENTCPTSGTLYTLEMKSVALSSVAQNTEVALSTTYATETGGTAYIGNKNSDGSKAQIKAENGGIIYFNGADAYVKIVLDCPLQTGDSLYFTNGNGTRQICFTTTNTRATTYSTTSNKYEFPAAFDAVSTIYVWRTEGSSTYVHSINIKRSSAKTDATVFAFSNGTFSNWSSCSGGTLTLAGSQTGVSYQLYKDGAVSGAALAGTGSALSWTVTASGTYIVKSVANTTYNETAMTGSAVVTIQDPTLAGPSTVVVGSAITLTHPNYTTEGGNWESSNTSVATVSNAGVVTGVAAGSVTITFHGVGSCDGTKEITVTTSATTYTLTATAAIKTGRAGSFTGSATITNSPVGNIPSGTAVTSSANTFIVNGTTVTAPATIAGTADVTEVNPEEAAPIACTWRFNHWENLPATVTADVSTVQAVYVPTFNLMLDTDGGTINAGNINYYIFSGSDDPSTITVLPTNVTKSGYTFAGWKQPASGNNFTEINGEYYGDFADDYRLVAQWIADGDDDDDCNDRQTLSKVVLTSTSAGTVSGYNNGEYAGAAVIGGLATGNSPQNSAEVDASHAGNETGYKLNGSGSAILFATLAKGAFHAGDIVKITITYQNDNYTYPSPVSAKTGMDIYYGINTSDATLLTTLSGVTGPGTYSYTLTAADVTAIGSKQGIGVFRKSDRAQNHYVYSVEITGCRDWCLTPVITTQPADQEILVGRTATLTVEATATSPTYQWYNATNNTAIGTGAAGTAVTGATNASFSTPQIDNEGDYEFYCVITDGDCEVTSETATIAVTTDIACSDWDVASLSSGSTVTIRSRFSIKNNTGKGTTSKTLWTGSIVSLEVQASNDKYVEVALVNTAALYNIFSVELGVSTDQAYTSEYVVFFSSNATFNTSEIVGYEVLTAHKKGDHATVTVEVPENAKSMRIYSQNSNLGGATYGDGTTVFVYYIDICYETCFKPGSPTATAANGTAAQEYAQNSAAGSMNASATGDVTACQWYSSTSNDINSGSPISGATTGSYVPPTTLIGTTYYWCVFSNECSSVSTNTIAITITDPRPAPTVDWTGTTITDVNYGGGGYTVTATVTSAGWDGTLQTDDLTAPDGVVLHDVTVSADGKTITATFDVTTAVEEEDYLTFTLDVPAATSFRAIESEYNVPFTMCEMADAETYVLPFTGSRTSSGTPTYRWETASVGWITCETGASSVGTSSASYDVFTHYNSSNKSNYLAYSEIANIGKIRIYLYGQSSNTRLSGISTASAYSSSAGGYSAVSITSVIYSNGGTSFNSSEQGYIEATLESPIAANSYIYISLTANSKVYGLKLITIAEDANAATTDLTWSGGLADGGTVTKQEGEADFVYTAATTSNTLGTISYSSSNTAVATVNATTGLVDINDNISWGSDEEKTVTITATLSVSGCYKKKVITYTLIVQKVPCYDTAGSIGASAGAASVTIKGDNIEKNICDEVTLTLTGFTPSEATIQWYKDGEELAGETSASIIVEDAGVYSATTHNTCYRESTNSISISNRAGITLTALYDYWYIKNGRRTPDVKLFSISGSTTFTASPASIGGCTFFEQNGFIYLEGKAPEGLTAGDQTVTITATDDCNNEITATIILKKQAATVKPSLAFVVDGTNGEAVTSVADSKTSDREIYTYLEESFLITGCNMYWSNNERELAQYYSQYDIILITDDPDTNQKPKTGKTYVDAFGSALLDVRPILTLEAYVGSKAGWQVNGTPSSPNPQQFKMTLQCKEHEIFVGTSYEEVGDDRIVTIVDQTKSPYSSSTDYEKNPALQGFDKSASAGLLGIGTIANRTLSAGVERQVQIAARMMILGINNKAMAALTADGKRVILNALLYLLKMDAEDIADCANYFTGETNEYWDVASNWTQAVLPDEDHEARILAPCVIRTSAIASDVRIITSGTSKNSIRAGKVCNGSISITPEGTLVIGGVLRSAVGPDYLSSTPTSPSDVRLRADANGAIGALVFNDPLGETGLVVEFISKAVGTYNAERTKLLTPSWQYIGSPLSDELHVIDHYSDTWISAWGETNGTWTALHNEDSMEPFYGYAFTRQMERTYSLDGHINPTTKVTLPITSTNGSAYRGWNLYANSWTAPIDLTQMTTDDFGGADATIYFYNTGKYSQWESYSDNPSGTTTTAGQYLAIPIAEAATLGKTTIPPMQGFFIYTTKTSSNTLTLDYDRMVRGGSATTHDALRAPKRVTDELKQVLHIQVFGQQMGDDLWLLQHPSFTDDYDNGHEAYKMGAATAASPMLYAKGVDDMAVHATDNLSGTEIAFWKGSEDTDYTLHIYYSGTDSIVLTDLITGAEIPVGNHTQYAFTAYEGEPEIRFIVNTFRHWEPDNTEPGTDVPTDIQVVVQNGAFSVLNPGAEEMSITLFDATGKLLMQHTTDTSLTNIIVPQQGVYLMYVQSANVHKVVKIIK